MSIRIDEIKDPRLRARIEDALRTSARTGENPIAAASDSATRDCARPTRIQQNTKPLLNGLETKALAWLQATYPSATFHKQAWRVKLANGAWYKVDLCAFFDSRWHAWEAKFLRGKNATRGILALKCAAYQFPEVRWHLIWKQDGRWMTQEVLP
jgi:hypothetical protein